MAPVPLIWREEADILRRLNIAGFVSAKENGQKEKDRESVSLYL